MTFGFYLGGPWGNCTCSAQTLSCNPKEGSQEGSQEERLWTKEDTRVETGQGCLSTIFCLHSFLCKLHPHLV